MADAPARFVDLGLDARDNHALAGWWRAAIGQVRRDDLEDALTPGDDEPRPHDWPIPIVDPAGEGPLVRIVPATMVRQRDAEIECSVLAGPEGNESCVSAPE